MYESVDYYQLTNLLSEEEKLIQNTARQFVEDKFIPIITEYHRVGEFPVEIVKQLGELGFLGSTLPEEYGGAGLNNIAYGLIMQELERGDSGLRSFASVQGGLVIYPIYRFGSEEQKTKWLRSLISGYKIGCFGLTEPDFGSNPAGMKTTARKTSGGYRINGTKMWITNGSLADVAVVWAKLDDTIRGFLVEKGTPGFQVQTIKGKFSLRASDTAELVFDECEIPEENILPDTDGLKSPLKCLTQARYSIAWGTVGAAMACYDTALKYAQSRIQFDRPIAAYQLTQEKLVYMVTEITKAQLLNYHLAKLKDEQKMRSTHVSMAKRNNVEESLKIARMARSILGANGISDEYPVIRHMLNLETVSTYEGTHEIHTLILGEDITGIAAYY
ncbi:MAG: acyl-CoA dehydrogenase family protein [Calditrichia bacterium]|nr:acyl-CoA dehydrogenase family protein [Calditrichia bacterium]